MGTHLLNPFFYYSKAAPQEWKPGWFRGCGNRGNRAFRHGFWRIFWEDDFGAADWCLERVCLNTYFFSKDLVLSVAVDLSNIECFFWEPAKILYRDTPAKTNMEPENGPLEKGIPIGNHSSFPGSMLIFGGVYIKTLGVRYGTRSLLANRLKSMLTSHIDVASLVVVHLHSWKCRSGWKESQLWQSSSTYTGWIRKA